MFFSRRSTPSSSPRAPSIAPPATVFECFPLILAAWFAHPGVSSNFKKSIGQPCSDSVTSRSHPRRIVDGTAETRDPSHRSDARFLHDPSAAGSSKTNEPSADDFDASGFPETSTCSSAPH